MTFRQWLEEQGYLGEASKEEVILMEEAWNASLDQINPELIENKEDLKDEISYLKHE